MVDRSNQPVVVALLLLFFLATYYTTLTNLLLTCSFCENSQIWLAVQPKLNQAASHALKVSLYFTFHTWKNGHFLLFLSFSIALQNALCCDHTYCVMTFITVSCSRDIRISSKLIMAAKLSGRIDSVTDGKKKKGSAGMKWFAPQQSWCSLKTLAVTSFCLSPLLTAASFLIVSFLLSSNFIDEGRKHLFKRVLQLVCCSYNVRFL